MEKRILGLDPGIAILGFGAIVCNSNPVLGRSDAELESQRVYRSTAKAVSSQVIQKPVELLDFGIIQTPAKTDIGARLCTIYSDLQALLRELQPDLVAIEKLFFYRMSNTITVAQARGVLMLVLAQENLPYVEFTPAQIKQALTGYGNADKHEVQSAVAQELDLRIIPKPDDAADALAVALTAWFHL